MPEPSSETISNAAPLATASGTAIYKHGDCLVVADLGIHWAGTTRFVLGLFCFITSANGLVLSILDIAGGEGTWVGGLILLTVGFLTGLVFKQINRRVKSRRSAPLSTQEKKVIIDLTQKKLFAGNGRPLAQLSDTRFEKGFQISSSAPSLGVLYPGGKIVLVRGNVFMGGVDGIEAVLREYQLMN